MTKAARAVAIVTMSALVGASLVNVAVAQTPSTAKTEAEKNKSGKARDRETSASVRKAIVADKKLSANAHNVKIMTINGTVTLHGPVANSGEKERVGALAKEVAGVGEVINNVDVPPPRKSRRKTTAHH